MVTLRTLLESAAQHIEDGKNGLEFVRCWHPKVNCGIGMLMAIWHSAERAAQQNF